MENPYSQIAYRFLPEANAEDARRWLAMNTQNRNMSNIRAVNIKNAILRGEWRVASDAISIEGDYLLQNGQHRAYGLLLADEEKPGVTIPLFEISGLGPDSGLVTDIGKSRSLEDTLYFIGEGEAKPKLLSGAVTLAWHIHNGTYVSRLPTPTRPQQIDFLKTEAPDLRDAVELGGKLSREAHIPASGVIAAIWLIGRGSNVEHLDRFLAELTYGENLSRKDLTFKLRKLWVDWLEHKHSDRMRPWKVCALTVRVWNEWLDNPQKTLALYAVALDSIPEAK